MLHENCPNCGAWFKGKPRKDKPALHFHWIETHYSRLIGVEVRGVYDGILYWMCPDCGFAFHRFAEPYWTDKAQPYIDEVNAARVQP